MKRQKLRRAELRFLIGKMPKVLCPKCKKRAIVVFRADCAVKDIEVDTSEQKILAFEGGQITTVDEFSGRLFCEKCMEYLLAPLDYEIEVS